MTVYCSKKLESFLGEIPSTSEQPERSVFGDWNGHLFTVDRKRCLLFMNSKTCYSVMMKNVYKKDLKDFGQVFKERLIRQLDYDVRINEKQEVIVRKELANIVLRKSNNNKKIIGTMNHHIENLKYNNYQGGIDNWDEIEVTSILNDYLMTTKIAANTGTNGNYFIPVELMRELIG